MIGLEAFSILQDRMLLWISTLLALGTLLRCISFYWIVQAEAYEVVEGVCIELGRAGLRKRRKVRLLQEDGNEYTILLGKRMPLRLGNRYRIFFRCGDVAERDTELFPNFVMEDHFLGLEDMGEYHAAVGGTMDKEDIREG